MSLSLSFVFLYLSPRCKRRRRRAATVEKEGVWRREKFLTSLAITNTPGAAAGGQKQRLFYTLVSQGWKASWKEATLWETALRQAAQ